MAAVYRTGQGLNALSRVRLDKATRVDVYESYDGGEHLQASLLLRTGYSPELRIPQRGHSKTEDGGDFSTFLSAEVVKALAEAL